MYVLSFFFCATLCCSLPSLDAPARLRKELDSLLNLQATLEVVELEIQNTCALLEKEPIQDDGNTSPLEGLERTHARLQKKVQDLYVSLNIDDISLVQGISLDAIHLLILARDLKINIRRRSVGVFLELDRLNQASGGRDNALGTRLHQQARGSIARRRPAITNSIHRFNNYIEQLEGIYDKSWNIPLPARLSTDLSTLRDEPGLMEDVWITPPPIPSQSLWLEDPSIRKGIRALLKYDRCIEERQRIGREADNLCRWYCRRLAAIELAISSPESM